MKVIFFVPHLNTNYAGRTLYNGFKNAFIDLGHSFRFLTVDDNQPEVFQSFEPDILITSLTNYFLKFLDLHEVYAAKQRGMKVFVSTPMWKSPFSKLRVNESPSLSTQKKLVELITKDKLGDIYFSPIEQGDERMAGFKEATGYDCLTVPLAADKTIIYSEYNLKFKKDISFLGTYLPEKRPFFQETIFPLKGKYNIGLYGQDWTFSYKAVSNLKKVGQFLNIPILKNIHKPSLELSDERKIYTSSLISINVHEEYQKKFGTDCNERTFKIPLAGGFEICDDVACVKKYFKEGEEIVIAYDKKDWWEKFEYFIKNPEKRLSIIEAGKKRVLADHTYHNRVKSLLDLYATIKT